MFQKARDWLWDNEEMRQNHAQEAFNSGRYFNEALRLLDNLDTESWKKTVQVSETQDEAVRDW